MPRKTKIVATIGALRGGDSDPYFDPEGRRLTRLTEPAELLKWFIDAGVDLIRFNMSFAGGPNGLYADTEGQYLNWMKANEDVTRNVAVLGDLPGPKIRVDSLAPGDPLQLEEGSIFNLKIRNDVTADEPSGIMLVNGKPFADAVGAVGNVGDLSAYLRQESDAGRQVVVGLDDGMIRLKCESLLQDVLRCTVMAGGQLRKTKGVTLYGAKLDVPAFQEPDKTALDWLVENASDLLAWVAVSFVQSKQDVLAVKHHLAQKKLDSVPGVIAKIETPVAIEPELLDEIIDVADGIMVARGDLGEQLPTERVPEIQKRIIRECNVRGKPVITATQMLDSMRKLPKPTRAEATDVFNAIVDGSDAVMLSGETSAGLYPVQAIKTMDSIARSAEKYLGTSPRRWGEIVNESRKIVPRATARLERFRREAHKNWTDTKDPYYCWEESFFQGKVDRSNRQSVTDRICRAACSLGQEGEVVAIISPTTTGRTVFMMARLRPSVRIIGVAHDERIRRKLLLSYGVAPINIGMGQKTVDQIVSDAVEAALREGLLPDGIRLGRRLVGFEVVATAGVPLFHPGTMNQIQIRRVNVRANGSWTLM